MPEIVSGPAVIGEFEKVGFSNFADALRKNVLAGVEEEQLKTAYDELMMPQRATSGSAGYDFHSPVSFTLRPGESVTIPTGIRVRIHDGWFLMCAPRSGLGFKYRLQLDNTVGIIDSDYYYSDNEGHIMLRITNDNRRGRELTVERNQSFAQGIFVPFGITMSDNAEAVRNGGMGSTDK